MSKDEGLFQTILPQPEQFTKDILEQQRNWMQATMENRFSRAG